LAPRTHFLFTQSGLSGLEKGGKVTEIKNGPKPGDGLTRRGFIKLAGCAAFGGATAIALPDIAMAAKKDRAKPVFPPENQFWESIRQEFILDPDVVYMNIGTTGAMPRRVLENYVEYNQLAASRPRTFESELGATFGLPDQRAELASQFGCNPDEICLSRNTTDGMDAILNGLEFNAGDEILLTHHEHIGALSPLNVLQDRFGVVLTEVEIPVLDVRNARQFIVPFARKISRRTKAIVFSHITYKTGTRLPAKELCRFARENGLISIVDGAHAPGMITLDFHDMGCDFYAGAGHKWQCGPGCTGILYMRNHGENLPQFWPQNCSTYTFLAQPKGNLRGQYDIAYAMQYRGQANISAQLAMVDACNMWERIGRERIEAYVCGLSAHLKKALRQKFDGLGTFFCPDKPEFASGLTSFNPFADVTDGAKLTTYVQRLQDEYGYQVRYTNFRLFQDDLDDTYAVRVSTHLFHNREQVEGLAAAMFDLYGHMRG
jgi:selenocysteine lyase/cysteine desulfurase